MRRVGVVLVALALSGACAAPAGAQVGGVVFTFGSPHEVHVDRVTTIPVEVTGAVAVDFSGDAVGGCETVGLCGARGTIGWTPPARAELILLDFRTRGGRFRSYVMGLDEAFGSGSGARVRVARTTATGVRKTCSDVAAFSTVTQDQARPRGQLELKLADADALGFAGGIGPGLGRCGGPLPSELIAVLPTRSVSARALRRGRMRVDLRGERALSAHGITGTLRSSVALRLGTPTVEQEEGEDEEDDPFETRPTRVLTARYQIEDASGTVRTDFQGLASPLCDPLDSCGLSGVVNQVHESKHGSVAVVAEAPKARPRRDLLAALGIGRGDPRGVEVIGFGTTGGERGRVTSSVVGDGRSCSDAVPLGRKEIFVEFKRGRVSSSFGAKNTTDGALMRTRCPGPMLEDAAEGPPLARGSVPLAEFGKRVVEIPLTGSSTFSGEGYSGRTTSDLKLVLRRTSIRQSFSETLAIAKSNR